MVESRQGKQSDLVIQSNRHWVREGVTILFSLILWSYCFYVMYFFVGALFYQNGHFISIAKISFKMTNKDIRGFLFMAFFMWAVFYVGLWCWKIYNMKRFGSLKRRKYPLPTSKADLLALGLVDDKDYETLQNSKYIVFEKNPIRDLG